jgi:hypothetical protein
VILTFLKESGWESKLIGNKILAESSKDAQRQPKIAR